MSSRNNLILYCCLGNFGTERHFLEGFVTPQVLPTLQSGARPAMFRRDSNYSTTSDEARETTDKSIIHSVTQQSLEQIESGMENKALIDDKIND